MVEIPIILKLKKQNHKDIAKAQDIIIKNLYNVFENAIFHGGTAIWRCYGGNRFSEDIDVYIEKDITKIENLFRLFQKEGFVIKKKKIGNNCLYSTLLLNRVIVRFEALFKKRLPKGVLGEYLINDGMYITVITLSPEELICEKVNAYLNRLKIRDLFDIFFLLRHVKNKNLIRKDLDKLIKNFSNPIDEHELKVLILEGFAPKVSNMVEYIRRWE